MVNIENYNFAGKRVIVRVDFNVPLDDNGKITDDTRIKGALPTLKKILADGGSLIIMSHMGKPKGKVNAKYSLSQIVDAVAEKLGVKVNFADDCAKADAFATAFMVMGKEKAMEYCKGDRSIEGYFIYSDENGNMQTAMTEGFRKYIRR